MKKLLQQSLLLLLALAGIASAQAQSIYENYAITSLATTYSDPTGVAVDSAGNIYVADKLRYVLYKVTPDGHQTVWVGKVASYGTVDGVGNAARLEGPEQMAFDSHDNLYFGDGLFGSTVRMVTPDRVVTTLAGSHTERGSADGTGGEARFSVVASLVLDRNGNIYIADEGNNNTIRRMTPALVVTTIAGLAGSPGYADGIGSAARFNQPRGLAIGRGGFIYVADSNNRVIRRVTPAGATATVAGQPGVPGSTDGNGTSALFNLPLGMAFDQFNNLYIADAGSHTVRKIDRHRNVTTLAGSPGQIGFVDGVGADARFTIPVSIAVDSLATIYVGDAMSFPPSHVRIGVPVN